MSLLSTRLELTDLRCHGVEYRASVCLRILLERSQALFEFCPQDVVHQLNRIRLEVLHLLDRYLRHSDAGAYQSEVTGPLKVS